MNPCDSDSFNTKKKDKELTDSLRIVSLASDDTNLLQADMFKLEHPQLWNRSNQKFEEERSVLYIPPYYPLQSPHKYLTRTTESPQKSRTKLIRSTHESIHSKTSNHLTPLVKHRYLQHNIDKSKFENLDNLVDTMSVSTSSSSCKSHARDTFSLLVDTDIESPIVKLTSEHDTFNNSLPSPSNNLLLPPRTTMRKELLSFSNQTTTQSYSHHQSFRIPMTFERTDSTNSSACNVMNDILCHLPDYRSHYASRVTYPDCNYAPEPIDTYPTQKLVPSPSNSLLVPPRTQMRKDLLRSKLSPEKKMEYDISKGNGSTVSSPTTLLFVPPRTELRRDVLTFCKQQQNFSKNI